MTATNPESASHGKHFDIAAHTRESAWAKFMRQHFPADGLPAPQDYAVTLHGTIEMGAKP